MGVPFEWTVDGYELQWQVNYLAPYLFVSELLPLLLTTASMSEGKARVRIVNLSSDMATLLGPKRILLEDVNMTDNKGMTVLLCVHTLLPPKFSMDNQLTHNRITGSAIHTPSKPPSVTPKS